MQEEGTAQRIVELALRRFPNEGTLAVSAIDLIERLNGTVSPQVLLLTDSPITYISELK